MVRFLLLILLGATLHAASPFAGRWDITIKSATETYPDWLEVTENGGSLTARVQPKDGSVHSVKSVSVEGSHLLVAFAWGGRTRQLAHRFAKKLARRDRGRRRRPRAGLETRHA
jgi:hypothetical protein